MPNKYKFVMDSWSTLIKFLLKVLLSHVKIFLDKFIAPIYNRK
jgi:hypothetical protein